MSVEAKKDLTLFKKEIPLAPFTTLRVGGPAQYFGTAKSEEELLQMVATAQGEGLPFFILGGGSNLLVSDEGFRGLVILNRCRGVEVNGDLVTASAGEPLGGLVEDALKGGLSGLEWASGIPGTVGGAVRGNAGAFGHHFSEVVERVEILDKSGVKKLSAKQCHFSYRESVFKGRPWVVLKVVVRLSPGDEAQGRSLAKDYLKRRNLPPFPSAGCIFKNVVFGAEGAGFQKLIPPDKVKGGMVSTGYLIDRCGLKGTTIGGAKISAEHANVFVNLGEAKASDFLSLIDLAKERVWEDFGAALEEEICLLGFKEGESKGG
jgi:UDP-N-acetylmuramate dehydrogenase